MTNNELRELFKNYAGYLLNWLESPNISITNSELVGSVSYSQSVNSGDELTLGSCCISSIEIQLENMGMAVNNISGTEFFWKVAPEIQKNINYRFAKSTKSKLIAVNGEIAYVVYDKTPYLSIWDYSANSKIKDVENQPIISIKSLIINEDKLYALHDQEPYISQFSILGQDLVPVSDSIPLNEFEIQKIKRYCSKKTALNLKGDYLYDYKVDQIDLSPTNLIERKYQFLPMGYFTAEKPTKVNDTKVKVKCYDRMQKFEPVADTLINGLKYPLTLKSFLQKLCQWASVDYLDSTFPNQNYLINQNFKPENVSGIQVLRWISEAASSFGFIDRQGKFSLNWYNSIDYFVDEKSYLSISIEEYSVSPITKLQIKVTDNDVGPILGEGTNAYVIQNNPLLYAQSTAELAPAASEIYNRIKSFTYTPYSLSTINNYALDPGSIISLTSRKGQKINALVMSINASGGTSEYQATGNEKRLTQVSMTNQIITQLRGKTNEIRFDLDETVNRLYDPVTGDITVLRITTKGLELAQNNHKLVFNAEGLSIYNGGFRIFDLSNTKVFGVDLQGQIFATGTFTSERTKPGGATTTGVVGYGGFRLSVNGSTVGEFFITDTLESCINTDLIYTKEIALNPADGLDEITIYGGIEVGGDLYVLGTSYLFAPNLNRVCRLTMRHASVSSERIDIDYVAWD